LKHIYFKLRWVSVFWALAIVFLVESPSVLIIENSVRIMTVQEINRVGIMCIITFSLFALFCFVIGLITCVRIMRSPAKVGSIEFNSLSKRRQNRFTDLLIGLVFGILPLFTLIEPIVNLFIRRGLEASLAEDYWIWLFIASGVVVWIVVQSLIFFILIGRVKIEIDKNIEEKTGKSRKRYVLIGVTACFLIAIVVVTVMRNGSWLLQPTISTVPRVEHVEHEITYDSNSGVYTIESGDEDFHILQLTDIHLGGSVISMSKDKAALDAIYTLVESEKPDLIIITGDCVFPLGVMSFSLNNYVPMIELASFMRNLGIPWAVTFGNHDTEDIATHNANDISKVFDQFGFEKTGSLLYPEIQPDITGRSNQMILIKNPDGTLKQALFLIDSNDYQSSGINDYDYIHDDQVKWYSDSLISLKNEYGKMPPSLLFFHIPLKQYQTAYDLYKAGSDKVQYHYGIVGEENEAICASKHDSILFETAKEIGSTKGMFVGHDHYNNISMTYKGIRLTYGMSIDYLAMPGIDKRDEQRGETRITIHKDGSFDCTPLPLRNLELVDK